MKPSTPIHIHENVKSTIEFETSITDVQETIDHLIDQICTNLAKSSDTKVHLNDDKTSNAKHQRKIIKLERRLSRLSRIIRELEEKDMSLDEMAHCDLYVVESNLKKQACEVK